MNTNIGINLFDYVGDKQIGFINFKEGCIEIVSARGSEELDFCTPMDIPSVYDNIITTLHVFGIRHDGARLTGDELEGLNKMGELYMLSDIATINVMIILCLLGKVDDYNTWYPVGMRETFAKHLKTEIVNNAIKVWYDDTLIFVDMVGNDILNNEVTLNYLYDMAYYRFTGTFNTDVSCNCNHEVIEKPDDVSIFSEEREYLYKLIKDTNKDIVSNKNVLTIVTHNGSYRDYVCVFYINDTLYIYALTDHFKAHIMSIKIPDYFKHSDILSDYIWYLLSKMARVRFNGDTVYSEHPFSELLNGKYPIFKYDSQEKACRQLLSPVEFDGGFKSMFGRAVSIMKS